MSKVKLLKKDFSNIWKEALKTVEDPTELKFLNDYLKIRIVKIINPDFREEDDVPQGNWKTLFDLLEKDIEKLLKI